MRLELYTDVALTRDMPELGLRRGDLVKVVEHHVAPDGEEGYSIEVFNAVGETIAVTTVPVSALEALREDEVLSVRTLARALDVLRRCGNVLSASTQRGGYNKRSG